MQFLIRGSESSQNSPGFLGEAAGQAVVARTRLAQSSAVWAVVRTPRDLIWGGISRQEPELGGTAKGAEIFNICYKRERKLETHFVTWKTSPLNAPWVVWDVLCSFWPLSSSAWRRLSFVRRTKRLHLWTADAGVLTGKAAGTVMKSQHQTSRTSCRLALWLHSLQCSSQQASAQLSWFSEFNLVLYVEAEAVSGRPLPTWLFQRGSSEQHLAGKWRWKRARRNPGGEKPPLLPTFWCWIHQKDDGVAEEEAGRKFNTMLMGTALADGLGLGRRSFCSMVVESTRFGVRTTRVQIQVLTHKICNLFFKLKYSWLQFAILTLFWPLIFSAKVEVGIVPCP